MAEAIKPVESTDGGTPPVVSPQTTPEEEAAAKAKAEHDKEFDRRVQEATAKSVATIQKRLDDEAAKKVEAAKAEAEKTRLAQDGKHAELSEKLQAELDAMKAEKMTESLRAHTLQTLADKGIAPLADVFAVDLGTAEGRTKAIETISTYLEAEVGKRVEEQVNTRLGTSPAPPGAKTPGTPASLPAQIKEAMRTGNWAESLRLKNLAMAAQHEQQARPQLVASG